MVTNIIFIVFTFIFTLVCADIQIKIFVSNDPKLAKVVAIGMRTELISDTERATFGLDDGVLKDVIGKNGRRPDDLIFRNPTPWGDIYNYFKLPSSIPVRTTLRPMSARVIEVTSNPVILTTQKYKNDAHMPAKYGGKISHAIETSFETNVSKGGEGTVTQEVGVTLDFGGGTVGGTSSLSFTNNWGESKTHTLKETLTAESSVEVELQPGKACVAVLSASKGTMVVEVDYEAVLRGALICRYRDFLPFGRNHRYVPKNIVSVLKLAGLPTSIKFKETIKIGFFSDASVAVNNQTMT